MYDILETRGVAVHVLTARHLKHVPGRKTDVADCPWMHQLHIYGLRRGSFRPDADLWALRASIRHRDTLIRYRSAHVPQMQKALHLMNVPLPNVISDSTGVTGIQLIRARVRGEHAPLTRAAYRHAHCAKREEDSANAFAGSARAEHRFARTPALEVSAVSHQQITACDQEIAQQDAAIPPQVDLPEQP